MLLQRICGLEPSDLYGAKQDGKIKDRKKLMAVLLMVMIAITVIPFIEPQISYADEPDGRLLSGD